jgi:hypothetical protein
MQSWAILAIANPLVKVFRKCAFMRARVTVFIFFRTGSVIYVLLCGGSKSTQKQDIVTAKKLARELKKDAK